MPVTLPVRKYFIRTTSFPASDQSDLEHFHLPGPTHPEKRDGVPVVSLFAVDHNFESFNLIKQAAASLPIPWGSSWVRQYHSFLGLSCPTCSSYSPRHCVSASSCPQSFLYSSPLHRQRDFSRTFCGFPASGSPCFNFRFWTDYSWLCRLGFSALPEAEVINDRFDPAAGSCTPATVQAVRQLPRFLRQVCRV